MTRNEAIQLLNLMENYTDDDLKLAFRKTAMQTHPDREGGSAEDFAQVAQAHRLLSVKVCAVCSGTGRITVYDGPMKTTKECPTCWNKEN